MRSVEVTVPGGRSIEIGPGSELALIAGPCVIESEEVCFRVAEVVKGICDKLGIGYIFKASFDKANRTSGESFRGPGLEEGLKVLAGVRREFGVPVVSDVHLPEQAAVAAEVLDVLQIPAFLVRQTDLVEAAARTGKCLQVKKAPFMAPWDMKNVVDKIRGQGNDNILLVERGSSFGYNRLICDMTAIPEMQALGYPVVMDATHSTQRPGGLGTSSGGSAALGKVIARAGLAAGANALFLETHPDPEAALSDGAAMIPLGELESLLVTCQGIYQSVQGAGTV